MKLNTLREYMELVESSAENDPLVKKWISRELRNNSKYRYIHPLLGDDGSLIPNTEIVEFNVNFESAHGVNLNSLSGKFEYCAEDDISIGLLDIQKSKINTVTYKFKIICADVNSYKKEFSKLFKQYGNFEYTDAESDFDPSVMKEYAELSKKCKEVTKTDSKYEFVVNDDTSIYVMLNGYVRVAVKGNPRLQMIQKPSPDDKLENAIKYAHKYAMKKYFKLNESSGSYVLELKDFETGKSIGYYVADDEDITKNAKNAYQYDSKSEAQNEANICNKQWDLEKGQLFVVSEI